MKRQGLKGTEQGFAALIIAITLVVVISLVAVGFAQLMRNEIAQSTNKHLSNQAYYAAESGVNDAMKALSLGYTKKKTTCGPIASPADQAETYLSSNSVEGTNTEWTCLLIDSAPGTLQYSPVDQVSPTSFVARGVDAAGTPVNFTSITISWQDASTSSPQGIRGSTGVSNNSFATSASWNAMGMVRAALTPLPAGPVDRSTLTSSTFTAFLYPASTGNNNSAGYTTNPPAQGIVMDGSCSAARTPLRCSVTINGLNTPRLLFNLRSIYSDTKIFITANGGSAKMADAQSLVDSTGRAENVLKRIQVRIPSDGSYHYPGFAVQTIGDLCKQLRVRPGYSSAGC